MAEFSIVGPSYITTAGNSDCQRTMNWYPEVIESSMGKGKVTLESCPGTQVAYQFQTRNGTGGTYGRINAVYVDQEKMWVVACGALYLFDGVNTATFKVELANTAGACPDNAAISIASNGKELLICASDFGTVSLGVWLYTIATNTVVCQGVGAYPDTWNSTQCAFLDGYFILFAPVTAGQWSQKFYISGIYDGTKWDGLDFASAEGNPDRLVAICVDHCELWLFGRQTTEIFVNTGNADFPFQRTSTAVFDYGISSFRSLVKLDNSLFFLGGDQRGTGIVYRTRGYQVERVSTHAVEASLTKTAYDPEMVYAYAYTEAGHSFYCLTLSASRATWVYDTVTGLWHERGAWNGGLGDFLAMPWASHCYYKGDHYVCGPEADYIAPFSVANKFGVLYRQSVNLPSRAGDDIRRARVTPHLSAEQAWAFYHQLWMDVECSAATPITPSIVLDWSDDGGKTWSTQHTVTLPATGSAGAQKFRAIWRRLGRGRDRVYRFYVESQCRWTVTNGYLNYTPGTGI